MFWKMVKARTDALKNKNNVNNDKVTAKEKEAFEGLEIILTKAYEAATATSVCRETLKEALKATTGDAYNETLEKIMDICRKVPTFFYQCLLELLAEDKTILYKCQADVLKWIIIQRNRDFLFAFISKLKITERDTEILYKKTIYLEESGDFYHGQGTIYSMLIDMPPEELREFFRLNSENASLRVAVSANLDTILEALLYQRECDIDEAVFGIVEFCPECIKPAFLYILSRNKYTWDCELELHVLQAIIDSRYGYLLPEYSMVRELNEWVKNNARDIIVKADLQNCTSQIVWLLENEFGVDIDGIYDIMEEFVLSFIGDLEWDGCLEEHDYLCDFDLWNDFIWSAAGYYVLCGSRYNLAKVFPRDVVEIKNSFPNTDSERLLEAAGALN